MGEFDIWVGRQEEALDVATLSAADRLAAVLDHQAPPWRAGETPPLGHWLYFLPSARQAQMDVDGHPKRGGFLPPVPLPRRMWAGGRQTFAAPLPAEGPLRRRSTIAQVAAKSGTSGELVFVTVRHEVFAGETACVVEEQDLVYREPTAPAAPTAPPVRVAAEPVPDVSRSVTCDAVQLFRYSALTFNAHRIHYDRDYAIHEEGYPGLVVHGPLIATLLMDLQLRDRPNAQVVGFSFRAQRPTFDGRAFSLNLKRTEAGADLWAAGEDGTVAMSAKVETAA
ncbi:MAG: hypothetical protein Q8M88_04030 [Phenylobacterium sp.]|uniref:hypothetical protein n=1 Tax=Phenylobacterium sp. TaxID=1871053 RepID=UPI0027352922|nr:hypothetical protein [Phenylobacterium sp.]MDP3173583.1 hypothetical protein [Phenylobacterium sp.]